MTQPKKPMDTVAFEERGVLKYCPKCGSLLEVADYLEGENGFEEALICMECDDDKFYPIIEEPLFQTCTNDTMRRF